jgi:hypothetical protein
MSKTLYSLHDYFFNQPVKVDIYDPIATAFTIAIYQFMPEGTKLTIQNNQIRVVEPSIFQPVVRWIQKSGYTELGALGEPIMGFAQMRKLEKISDEDYTFVGELMISSLLRLKKLYQHLKLVGHTMDRFIFIIQNWKTVEIDHGENLNKQFYQAWLENDRLKLHIMFLRLINNGDSNLDQFVNMLNRNEHIIRTQLVF